MAGNHTRDNGYNERLDEQLPTINVLQLAELHALRDYFGRTVCNHNYYAHHGFEKVTEFKSHKWKADSDDYLTYICRKHF